MILLTDKIEFPNVSFASPEGLLAYGGDLSTERLLLAYKSGIFPWYEIDQPILWWSPDPRFVLFPSELKVSKSMKKMLRDDVFRITYNQDFKSVIKECSKIKRKGQEGTWITSQMADAYTKLHEQGYVKSIEVWEEDNLVGGLYGVDLNNGVFCGESMFSKVSNASKFGFIKFIQESNYKLVDCQVYTSHLESLGAKNIAREAFMSYIK